ncbi:transglutaminase TgpA family protein [Pseudomonas sp. LRF_L74]|uniref:transglutaminase TgpA family protein n=1 Tax=Pseudomonas sp. LRF_L74 TaxID=3369422 RepID=UPI003F60D7B7
MIGSTSQPIPRIGLTWLLVAQVLVILPHLLHLPLWIVPLWLVCAGWRVQVFRMRVRYATRFERIGLLILTAIAVFLSRGSLVGLDAGVLLLVATFILKLVELRSKRDALLLIFLGFFVVVTSYLFDDSLLSALYSVLPVSALLAALIGLQQSSLAQRPAATLKLAGSMLLQALPLMLVLFLFFPRMGPLWSLPNPNKAFTGLSDNMAPADIASLSQSDALAFRASFEGRVPERRDLYWRALTLEHFDGRRWSQSFVDQGPDPVEWQRRGESLQYSIVMQPSGKPWLFALDVGMSTQQGIRQRNDFRLENRRPILQNFMYSVTSWPAAIRQPTLSEPMRRRDLQLPKDGDPRARAWAGQLRERYTDDQALAGEVLRHFNREPFAYTLQPPILGRDSIDEFLFDSRRGFCAHYAGAMTFVLRAAGIPARVVAGYQGGDFNRNGSYVSVRQFDAHAWIEYWIEGKGWISADPTAQVSPERIEYGLERAVQDEQSFLQDSPLSLLRYRDIGWLNELRLGWDSLNYNWQRWVLGYKAEQQMQTLQRLFGSFDWQRLGLVMAAALVLLLGGLSLLLLRPWRRRSRDPQQVLLLRFEKLLARHGMRRGRGEGVRAFAVRASQRLPAQREAIMAFANAFEAQRYAGHGPSPNSLGKALARLRRTLPWKRTHDA